MINYTYSERSNYGDFVRSKIIEIMNLKLNFSLLFFEHGYHICYLPFQSEIFCVYS